MLQHYPASQAPLFVPHVAHNNPIPNEFFGRQKGETLSRLFRSGRATYGVTGKTVLSARGSVPLARHSRLSAPLLGEVIAPLQGLGGEITLGALVAFQLRR